MNKKAQSAIEFLMTYGWVVIVIAISIGALWTFGVFNVETPAKCDIGKPINCLEARILEDEISILIFVEDVQNPRIESIKINGEACALDIQDLEPEKENVVNCVGLNVEKGENIIAVIESSYQKLGSTIEHNIEGTVSGTVK
jgi:hypothetical protein